MGDIKISKLTLNTELAARVLSWKRDGETVTGAVLRSIRDGLSARSTARTIGLHAMSAMRELDSGDNRAARVYLRSILELATMGDPPDPPAHWTNDGSTTIDIDRQVEA